MVKRVKQDLTDEAVYIIRTNKRIVLASQAQGKLTSETFKFFFFFFFFFLKKKILYNINSRH